MNQITIKLTPEDLTLIKATIKVLHGLITQEQYLTTMSVIGYNGTAKYDMFLAFAVEQSLKKLT